MKRLACICIFLGRTLFAADWHPADGNAATLQAIFDGTTLNAGLPIAAADIVHVPTGNWTWGTTVRFDGYTKGFNIQIIGDNPRPVITGTSTSGFMLWYSCSNAGSPKTTARISNLEFFNQPGVDRLLVDGVATIDQSGTTFTGGFRVDHCRFSQAYYTGTPYTLTQCSVSSGALKTLTCTDGAFGSSDIVSGQATSGRVVWGNGNIPAYTKIASVTDATHITLDTAATAAFTNQTVKFTGTTEQVSGHWIDLSGWIFGVIDHCDYDSNIVRYCGVRADFANAKTSPTGTAGGTNGDYAQSFMRSGKQDVAGGLDAVYLEDNILHHGTGGFTDVSGGSGGGAILVARHNTCWGSLASHGTRETGVNGHGARLLEYYNNHFVRNNGTLQQRQDNGAVEDRDGEQLNYNNYLTTQSGWNITSQSSMNSVCTGTAAYCTAYVMNTNRWYYGPDGLNPWDENQKGNFTDVNGNAHQPYASYNHVQPSGNAIMKGYDTAHGLDSSDTVGTPSPGGVDTDSRFGDVYATLSGITITRNADQTMNLVASTVNGTALPNPIPANYFAAFVVRNAEISRSLNSTATSFSIIFSHTAGSGTGGNQNVTFTLSNSNVGGTSHPLLNITGSHIELRKVKQYMGVPGLGQMTVAITPNSSPASLVTDNASGQNPYWVGGLPSDAGGAWNWSNFRRTGTGAWINEVVVSNFNTTYIDRGFVQVLGSTTVDPTIAPYNSWKLFQRGYQWNPNATGTNLANRVGADWGVAYTDPVTGVVMASTIGTASPATGGGTSNTATPEFASFYRDGTGGYTYPHPLIQAPAASLPSFISATSTTFTVNVAGSFTVTANGTPTPSFTQSGKPSWVTFTDNANGTATLSGTPTSTSGQPFTITFTASNSQGSTNQTFTLNVANPTITLDTPADGSTFTVGSVINMTATPVSPNSITKVEFYQGSTLLNTDTTSPYAFAWTGAAIGSYAVKAKVYDSAGGIADSNIANITVTSASVTPTPSPAVFQVKP